MCNTCGHATTNLVELMKKCDEHSHLTGQTCDRGNTFEHVQIEKIEIPTFQPQVDTLTVAGVGLQAPPDSGATTMSITAFRSCSCQLLTCCLMNSGKEIS